MLTRAEKEEEIGLLSDLFKKGHVSICANYSGTNVVKITQFRKELFKKSSTGRVAKNALAKLAAKKGLADKNSSEVEKFLAKFEGMNMFIFGKEDPVSPAKVIADFQKANENFKVQGGFLDGAFLTAEAVKELANMPTKEEAQAKLLGVLNGSAQQFLRLLQAPASSLVRLLEARRKQLEEQSGGAAPSA